ncbi:LAFA_0G04676g1_1 [Lachancea sp. 'fantastica']|nr:LAFA_0G04676g1_1 [Lachancea sp. 'fantastica']
MEVHTPISTPRSKNVHSPPSVGSISPASTRNFKKFSGNVFTRVNSGIRSLSTSNASSPANYHHTFEERPRIVQRNSSRFAPCENRDYEFGPSSLPQAKPVMNIGKRRTNAPAPLHLSPITPRPTPRKSHSTSTKVAPCLASPMDFRRSDYSSSDCASWVTASSVDPRRCLDFSVQASAKSHCTIDQPIFRDPWGDMYPEVESPTCAAELRKNVALLSGGPKNFAASSCSICSESFACALDGEKLIELSCNHQCHYNCFLVSLEALLPANAFPKCSICGGHSKPKRDDVVSEITTKILCGGFAFPDTADSESFFTASNVKAQVFNQSDDTGNRKSGRKCDLRTPYDQVIKSADITIDGFKSYGGYDASPENLRTPSSQNSSFRSRSIASKGDGFEHDLDLSKPRIHLVPQLSKFNINEDAPVAKVQYVMTAYLPKCSSVAETASLLRKKEARIRNEIQNHVEGMLQLSVSTGPLQTFDKMSYSEDEDTWTTVTAFMFQERLVLVAGESVIGNVSRDQVSQLHQLDPNTIIVNLKCKLLPEIFLRCDDSVGVIRKWFYYLKHVYLTSEDLSSSVVPLEQLTCNNWQILPESITQPIRPKSAELVDDTEVESRSSVFAPHGRLPIKIVVCISIINCHPELHSNEEHLLTLKSKLVQCLSCLSRQDLVGLVVVGRDGLGRVGPFGTFIGMVQKDWDGLLEFVDGLVVHSNDNFFENDVSELTVMLETCHKLICTIEQSQHDIQQLVIIGNDFPARALANKDDSQIRKIKNKLDFIVKDLRFSIHHHFTCNSRVLLSDLVEGHFYNVISTGSEALKDFSIGDLIAGLHESFVKSFSASLRCADSSVARFSSVERNGRLIELVQSVEEVVLEFGCLRPGQVKSVLLEIQIDVPRLRQRLEHYVLSREASSSLLQYSSQWYDHSGLLTHQGYSLGCDFKFSSCGTTVSLASAVQASLTSPFQDPQESDIETLNISLAPPMSASRDMIFASRQMELLIAETLMNVLVEVTVDVSSVLNQLISMVFCISRDCVCNDPRFYRLVKLEPLGRYAEKLSAQLYHITKLCSSQSSEDQALSRWEMCAMRGRLICQERL